MQSVASFRFLLKKSVCIHFFLKELTGHFYAFSSEWPVNPPKPHDHSYVLRCIFRYKMFWRQPAFYLLTPGKNSTEKEKTRVVMHAKVCKNVMQIQFENGAVVALRATASCLSIAKKYSVNLGCLMTLPSKFKWIMRPVTALTNVQYFEVNNRL